MKPKTKPVKATETTAAPLIMNDASLAEPSSRQVSVRSAKDHLSSLLEHAARGNEVIITSDGEPKARLLPVRAKSRPFRVDWELLRAQPLVPGALGAEDFVRADRDGRY